MKTKHIIFIKTIKYFGIFLSLGFLLPLAVSLIHFIISVLILFSTNININSGYSGIIQIIKNITSYILFTVITTRIISEKQYGEKMFSGYLQIFIAFSIYNIIPFLYYLDFGRGWLYTKFLYEFTGKIISLFFEPICFINYYTYNPVNSILFPYLLNLVIYFCSFNLIFYKIYKKLILKKDEKQGLSISKRILFMSISVPMLIFNSHFPLLDDILYFIGYIFLIISISGNSYLIINHHDAISFNETKYVPIIYIKIRKIFISVIIGIYVYWIIKMFMIILNNEEYNYTFGRDMIVPILNLIMVSLILSDIYNYLEQNYETKIIIIINRFRYLYIPYFMIVLIFYMFYFYAKMYSMLTLILFFTTVNFILAIFIGLVLLKISKEANKISNIKR